MTKISVIVPVYKVELYLKRCVDSILDQTYSNFDLILVDDGSPDRCPEICDSYMRIDKRVHVLHQKNMGLSAARNAGIEWTFKNSNSEWITFIDSDDWIVKDYLALLFSACKTQKTKVAVGGFSKVKKPQTIEIQNNAATLIKPEELYCTNRENAIIACGKLYSKECFSQIRYPVGVINEDAFVTYKILFSLDYVSYVSEPLYQYFVNEESITRSKYSLARLAGIQATEEEIEFYNAEGFERAKKRALIGYAIILAQNIHGLNATSIENKQCYLKQLREKLRKLIKTNLWILRDLNEDRMWVIEAAVPWIGVLYWGVYRKCHGNSKGV